MKKVLLIICCLFLITGCKEVIEEKSQVSFIDMEWVREGDDDEETISFRSDGSFSYYCACGNPVNDSDLCPSYKYNSKSNTINLKCDDKTDKMVTNIKVVSASDNELKLDFDGDIRIFNVKEEVELDEE